MDDNDMPNPFDDNFFTKSHAQVQQELAASGKTGTIPNLNTTNPLAGAQRDDHPDYIDTHGNLMTWDADWEGYMVAEPAEDRVNRTQLPTNTGTSDKPRLRRKSVPFTDDMVALLRQLHATGYTFIEIAEYINTIKGYETATADMVRTRILRGPTKRQPTRIITDEIVAALKASHREQD